MSVADDLLKSLEDFLQKLKSGEEIEFTRVIREETPDGPMHIRRKGKLKKNDKDVG